MRNRVARVARTTITTNKPKSSDMVADIDGTILSTLYSARHLACRGAFSLSGTQKTPEPADQASRRSMHTYAAIVPHRSLTGQEKRILAHLPLLSWEDNANIPRFARPIWLPPQEWVRV